MYIQPVLIKKKLQYFSGCRLHFPLHVKQLLTNSMSLWQVQWAVYPQKNLLLQKKTDIVSYPMPFFNVYNLHLTFSGRSVAVSSEADTSFFVSPITWDTNYCGWNEFALWILQEGALILFSIRTLLTLSLKSTSNGIQNPFCYVKRCSTMGKKVRQTIMSIWLNQEK